MTLLDCVLVTGGHGFIGTHLVPMLPKDLPVVVVDNLLKQVHPNLAKTDFSQNADTYVADISDLKAWDRVFSKYRPTTIIHLAAETSTGLSGTHIDTHTSTNINGLGVLLTALVQHKVVPKKFVIASSRAVYGEGNWIDLEGGLVAVEKRNIKDLSNHRWTPRNPLNLEVFLNDSKGHNWQVTPKNPTSVYGLTKSFQEDLLKLWSKTNEVSLSILRFQNVYGPGQTPSNSYTGILGLFIRRAMQGLALEVYEGGGIIRDFVFVTDVARSILQSLENDEMLSKADVGTGSQLSLLKVAEMITAHYGTSDPVIVNKFRVGDVRAAYCDPAGWLTGWVPKVTFEEGLPATIAYVEKFFG